MGLIDRSPNTLMKDIPGEWIQLKKEMAEGKPQTPDWKSVRSHVHPSRSCFREFIYFFLYGRIAILTARLDLHRAQ